MLKRLSKEIQILVRHSVYNDLLPSAEKTAFAKRLMSFNKQPVIATISLSESEKLRLRADVENAEKESNKLSVW